MIPISPSVLTPVPLGRRVGRTACGFSLVEVTLAVAVASLAIITLLGLLPQGLEMSRKTSLATTNSSIVEQIIRDLENVPWARLPVPSGGGGSSTVMLFNDQGIKQSADSKDVSFVAEITYLQASLPRSESEQEYLRRILIKVATSSNPNFQFEEDNRLSYVTFNHLLAKTR